MHRSTAAGAEVGASGGGSDEERQARREAAKHAIRRRRVGALCVLAAIAALVALSLSRSSGPAASPPESESRPAPPGPSSPRAARLARDDKAIDGVLAYTPYVSRGSNRGKEVALTFDDGPGPTTSALVRYLVRNGVPTTFFLVGKAIAERPEIVRKQHEAGFALGAHTMSHARLGSLTAAEQTNQILSSADRITEITGHAVKLVRPPYGSFNADTSRILHAERMLMVLWSVDTKDYEARTAKQVVRATLGGVRAGSVVLMHDGPGARPNTLAAVRRIVPALRRKGYRFVTLPTLLRDDPPPRKQPLPRSLAG